MTAVDQPLTDELLSALSVLGPQLRGLAILAASPTISTALPQILARERRRPRVGHA